MPYGYERARKRDKLIICALNIDNVQSHLRMLRSTVDLLTCLFCLVGHDRVKRYYSRCMLQRRYLLFWHNDAIPSVL